jgi:hypothetical protein
MDTLDSLNQALASRTLVSRLHLDVDSTTGHYDLLVELVETEQLMNPLTICFSDIAELKLETSAGGWVQFMMLRVVRSTDANAERRIQVIEREHNSVRLTCRAFEVIQ